MRSSFIEITVMGNKINVELYEFVNSKVLRTLSKAFVFNP